MIQEEEEEEEEERSLIEDLKRHTQLTIAWSRHGFLVPRWTWPAMAWRRDEEKERVWRFLLYSFDTGKGGARASALD
jgi:hypothetical protein